MGVLKDLSQLPEFNQRVIGYQTEDFETYNLVDCVYKGMNIFYNDITGKSEPNIEYWIEVPEMPSGISNYRLKEQYDKLNNKFKKAKSFAEYLNNKGSFGEENIQKLINILK